MNDARVCSKNTYFFFAFRTTFYHTCKSNEWIRQRNYIRHTQFRIYHYFVIPYVSWQFLLVFFYFFIYIFHSDVVYTYFRKRNSFTLFSLAWASKWISTRHEDESRKCVNVNSAHFREYIVGQEIEANENIYPNRWWSRHRKIIDFYCVRSHIYLSLLKCENLNTKHFSIVAFVACDKWFCEK